MKRELEIKAKINSKINGLSLKDTVDFTVKNLEKCGSIEEQQRVLLSLSEFYSNSVNQSKTIDGKTISDVIKATRQRLSVIAENKRISDELDRIGLVYADSDKEEETKTTSDITDQIDMKKEDIYKSANFQFCN